MIKKILPVGTDNFEKIRTEDFYYVDKTGMIKELLENRGEVNLFTRPRRFGKSLNMSMLKHFFEVGTDAHLFDGLAISKEVELCEKYMGAFPVIFLTLKQVSGLTFAQARENLWSTVAEAAEELDYLQDSEKLNERDKTKIYNLSEMNGNLEESLRLMSRMLHKHFGKKVIILIDEYDAPLQKAYENGYYNSMVQLMRQFFGYALKSNEALFFSVMTGCMRVARESIFSDLNNPVIHSITDQQFDEWFGFTDKETIQLLQDFGQEEYYEVAREWYDGYRFGNQNVYCPWDVINWCNQLLTSSDRVPQNFWANSGGTDIIRDFANLADRLTRDQISILIEGGTVRKKLTQELTYRDMANNLENIWSILFTSGYLTARQRYEDGSYELYIPNREVRNIFTEKVDDWFREYIFDDEEGLKEFFAALDAGDAKGMEDCLNDMLMDSISYLDGGNLEDKENFYHGLLLGMLKNRKGWDIKSNREAGKGRPDIVGYHLRSGDAFIIEVKYSKEEIDLLSDAKTALGQIDRQLYDQYFRAREVKNIKHYGIAFCKKYCRVVTANA